MSVASILVIDPDPDLGEALVEQLVADGYPVELARSIEHARALASMHPPKLVILGDLDAPRDVYELVHEIRVHSEQPTPWSHDPAVIVTSSKAQEADLLRAFEAGADDFLARPAGYLELRARAKALLRRAPGAEDACVLRVDTLEVDMSTHRVSVAGRQVDLRRLEYELLVQLAREPRRVFDKQELLRAVWGYRARGSTRTVDSHASRLRRKLEANDGRWVVNVWGVGYSLI